MYFIISGTVDVMDPNVEDSCVARLGAGESFGEKALLGEGLY